MGYPGLGDLRGKQSQCLASQNSVRKLTASCLQHPEVIRSPDICSNSSPECFNITGSIQSHQVGYLIGDSILPSDTLFKVFCLPVRLFHIEGKMLLRRITSPLRQAFKSIIYITQTQLGFNHHNSLLC